MLNVRLNKILEEKLVNYAEQNDLSKTSVVKEALVMYFSKKELTESPYLLGADLFGVAAGSSSDDSVKFKSRLKKKLHEKHTH